VCAREEVQKMSSKDVDDPDYEEDEVEEKDALGKDAAAAGGDEVAAPAGGDEKEEGEKSVEAETVPAGGQEKAVVGKVKTKRHFCKFWQEGRCDRGKLCGWAHREEEIGQQVLDPQGRKLRLCTFWCAGTCRKKSEDCEYAHGEGELLKKGPAAQGKKGGKGKAGGSGGKVKNTDQPGGGKRSRSATRGTRRSHSKNRRGRRSDSRSQVLPIIIQTCSLFPLHQDKTLSAK